jgi:hypothetical protein
MNHKKRLQLVLLGISLFLLLATVFSANRLLAQTGSGDAGEELEEVVLGTAFTFQGRLETAGSPVDDTCDFLFSLWDAVIGGSQIGSSQVTAGIAVDEGIFTAVIDFGANTFTGDARWLSISVRCPAGGGPYTGLSPRQPLTAAPNALSLPGLWTQPNTTSSNLIGGYSGNSTATGVVGGTIGGGGQNGAVNQVNDAFTTIGGGRGNTAGGLLSTVGGGEWNQAGGDYATISGGAFNLAFGLDAVVGGGINNSASGGWSVVGGGAANNAGADYAAIGGGQNNVVTDTHGTVGGGANNSALGIYTTIAGGEMNTARNWNATVGGGFFNLADGLMALIGGGSSNSAIGDYAAVAG